MQHSGFRYATCRSIGPRVGPCIEEYKVLVAFQEFLGVAGSGFPSTVILCAWLHAYMADLQSLPGLVTLQL